MGNSWTAINSNVFGPPETTTRGTVDRPCIAECFTENQYQGFSYLTACEHARLMAAAPDLLEECEMALNLLSEFEGIRFFVAEARLKAAIGKARGWK